MFIQLSLFISLLLCFVVSLCVVALGGGLVASSPATLRIGASFLHLLYMEHITKLEADPKL
jgi:hypothetical protein